MSVGTTARRLVYVPALDGLRAVAIAFVLVTHFGQPLVWPGGFGVDVFFVLSGFLITTLLWYELQAVDTVKFVSFYAKRAIRLVPALVVAVGLTLVAMPLLGVPLRDVVLQSISALLYLIPVTMPILGDTPYYGHLWTLGMEEYFYLAWPVLLLWLWRRGIRWQRIAVGSVALGVLLYLVKGASPLLGGPEAMPLRVGGIAIGCGVALVIAETSWRGDRRLMSLATVSSLAVAFLMSLVPTLMPFAFFVAACGAVAALFAVMAPGERNWLRSALGTGPLVFLGRISYEIYLVHMVVILVVVGLTGLHRYDVIWLATPLAIAAAAGLHYGLAPLQRRWRRPWGGRGV